MDKGLNSIFNKVTGRSRDSEAISLANLMREFGCVSEVIGADFEVFDSSGKLVYTVRKKAMSVNQLNTLLKVLYELQKYESDEAKKHERRRR